MKVPRVHFSIKAYHLYMDLKVALMMFKNKLPVVKVCKCGKFKPANYQADEWYPAHWLREYKALLKTETGYMLKTEKGYCSEKCWEDDVFGR